MKPAVVLDSEESKSLKAADLGVVATTSTDRNRWFVVCLVLLLVVIFQQMFLHSANKRAEANTEVIWMKMYPNGTWDVSNIKPNNTQEFFNATVDKLLTDYAVARHGIVPSTIRRDYGFSMQFMSPQLAGEFTSDKGFNAAAKAAAILDQKSHNTHNIAVGIIDHYEKSSATFGNNAGEVMRTNMYLDETVVNPLGMQTGTLKKYILSIHWRILSPKELKDKSTEYFRANPIGIEVVKENLYLDPAVKE